MRVYGGKCRKCNKFVFIPSKGRLYLIKKPGADINSKDFTYADGRKVKCTEEIICDCGNSIDWITQKR